MGACCSSLPPGNHHPEPAADDEQNHHHHNIRLNRRRRRRRRQQRRSFSLGAGEGGEVPAFAEFSLEELKAATNGFGAESIVSESSDKVPNLVYKGRLQNRRWIAVKKFARTTWPDPKQFAEEAWGVGKLRHRRLANLIGYCCDGDNRLLVAEYMPNDTLAKHLKKWNPGLYKESLRSGVPSLICTKPSISSGTLKMLVMTLIRMGVTIKDLSWCFLSFQEWTQQMKDLLEVRKRGDFTFRCKDFKAAIDCYSQFIDAGTIVSPTVYARRSLCHLMCDQPDSALQDGMQAQCIYPDWPTAFYMQAVALAKLNMQSDAMDMLHEATSLEEKMQKDGKSP
ncbi:hypothetical protein B296_00020543 [Ensete ventricosum]|uniref:non-specific serine/threonine protein kinase n=1 Tax=Ensete ventricosum TaxID=4639 RepID=A0A427ASX4_ENSVE|nr:hypothetical protein B296_00020543 [Ensete ventricosum]